MELEEEKEPDISTDAKPKKAKDKDEEFEDLLKEMERLNPKKRLSALIRNY